MQSRTATTASRDKPWRSGSTMTGSKYGAPEDCRRRSRSTICALAFPRTRAGIRGSRGRSLTSA